VSPAERARTVTWDGDEYEVYGILEDGLLLTDGDREVFVPHE
jgi:phage-related protein